MSETQTITIACKLKVDSKVVKEIDETLSTFQVIGVDLERFSCSNCKNKCDADYNGSKNIAALGSLINRPRGTGLFCEIKHEVQYIQLTLWDALGLQKTHA